MLARNIYAYLTQTLFNELRRTRPTRDADTTSNTPARACSLGVLCEYVPYWIHGSCMRRIVPFLAHSELSLPSIRNPVLAPVPSHLRSLHRGHRHNARYPHVRRHQPRLRHAPEAPAHRRRRGVRKAEAGLCGRDAGIARGAVGPGIYRME